MEYLGFYGTRHTLCCYKYKPEKIQIKQISRFLGVFETSELIVNFTSTKNPKKY